MVDVANVKLFGRKIGSLLWDSVRERAVFEYDDSFVGKGIEPSPLTMPVREGVVYAFGNSDNETFKGLPGMIAESLPDTYGQLLFQQWLSLIGRTSGNPVESLCFFGSRCMGALEYEPAVEIPWENKSTFAIESLIDVAQAALSEKKNFVANLQDDTENAVADILRIGTSAGGQRAKAIIAYNPQTGEVRSGQVPAPDGFGYYLIKLDGVSGEAGLKETNNHGRLEYSFHLLAKACGIAMSYCGLMEENGRAHFITERFDRKSGEKIHMQTLCGIAHYDYRLWHAYSYEQAFEVMRRLRLSYSEAQEMFRRMVFNVVIRNQDDHTKNISFLMNKDGHWTLSPAYDIAYAYNPHGRWTSQHQMSVNGKFDGITRNDLLASATRNNIKNASEIIDKVVEMCATWPNIALNCGIPSMVINKIHSNFNLFL